MKAREGDLIETDEGYIFDVKGLVHPKGRIIAFVRYVRKEKSERTRNGVPYAKVYALSERYILSKQMFPTYLVYDSVFDETLCEVPVNDVKKHYSPIKKLQELRKNKSLDQVECAALGFARQLKEKAGIPWSSIGISGSILVGLHMPNSDLDIIIYGSSNCRKVHSTLDGLLKNKNGQLKYYSLDELKALFDFRSKDTNVSFEDFVRTESRKTLQGKFLNRDYFVRFVKEWNETNEKYGNVQYRNFSYAKLEATVIDASESIFTPCIYGISNVQILSSPAIDNVKEIVSFRGRFCEQARNGEVVIAQGKVEQVIDKRQNREYFRLLLGNKPSDFMILA